MSLHSTKHFLQTRDLDEIVVPIQTELDLGKQAIQNNLDIHLPLLAKVIDRMHDSQKLPLRSILLSLSGRLFSYTGNELPHVASVLEYLNTAAALHQKIILTEEFRRYQKVFSNIWGNEASVLLGDYLLSIAFKTMTRLGNFELLDTISATTQAIARGQLLSISSYSWNHAESHALEIIQNKKASLYMAGVKCGAILGKANPEIQQALNEFGFNLGMGVELKKELAIIHNPNLLRMAVKNNNSIFPLCALMQKMYTRRQQSCLEKIMSRFSQNNFSVACEERLQFLLQENLIYEHMRNLIHNFLEKSERALTPLTHLDTSFLFKFAQKLLGPESFYPGNGIRRPTDFNFSETGVKND